MIKICPYFLLKRLKLSPQVQRNQGLSIVQVFWLPYRESDPKIDRGHIQKIYIACKDVQDKEAQRKEASDTSCKSLTRFSKIRKERRDSA